MSAVAWGMVGEMRQKNGALLLDLAQTAVSQVSEAKTAEAK